MCAASRRGLWTATSSSLLSRKNVVVTQQRREIWGYLKNRYLKSLERKANESPEDLAKQLSFVRALGQEYPDAVPRRIEMLLAGRLGANAEASEQLTREYFKALVATGAMDNAPLEELRARLGGVGTGATAAAGAAAGAALPPQQPISSMMGGSATAASAPWFFGGGAAGAAGAAKEPLVVSVAPAGWKSQLWRLVRVVLVAFVAISAFGALMDERGISGRMGAGSTHQIHTAETSDKRFADVCGVDEAKAELEEIVMYLKNPEKFTRLGGKLPKGCLLMGPPGTGKTLLARAIAGEAGVPFFYASGSEFEEMYVGVGARRVRDLFEAAKKRAPCIIFIDEIDAIGASRHLKEQQAMKMTLNQLLVEMDGFEQNAGVIVIGATNIADSLDSALLRPGRFDRHVAVPLPDVKGREQILKVYGDKVPLSDDVDLNELARGTPGMSGADLSNLVNVAALKAALDGASSVTNAALDHAKDKILMGAERKSAVLTPETMRMTAYHEGGHALVAIHTDGADPVHKATIMPRGQALGMVMQLPEGDQTSMSRRQMLARMDVCMGGRVAEEMVYGATEITSGASSDIYQATRLARNMVTKWGFSEEIGVVFHSTKAGSDDAPSGETRAAIDREVQRLLTQSYERAREIIVTRRSELDAIAKNLVERESLTGVELRAITVQFPKAPSTKKAPTILATPAAAPKVPTPQGTPPAKAAGQKIASA